MAFASVIAHDGSTPSSPLIFSRSDPMLVVFMRCQLGAGSRAARCAALKAIWFTAAPVQAAFNPAAVAGEVRDSKPVPATPLMVEHVTAASSAIETPMRR